MKQGGETTKMLDPPSQANGHGATDPLPPRDPEAAMRAAIEKIWGLRPSQGDIHCGHCWGRGRQDSVKILEEALGIERIGSDKKAPAPE